MPSYLIERTNKKTGESKTELVNTESVSLAILKQEMEHGEDYTYRLVGHLTVTNLDDHNKINKDKLDRFHQYRKAMAESSHTTPFVSRHTRDTINIALHNQTYQRHRLINRQPSKEWTRNERQR